MSWTALYMAGFEVTLHGRFCVITEGGLAGIEYSDLADSRGRKGMTPLRVPSLVVGEGYEHLQRQKYQSRIDETVQN